jgi:hypothetical protein
MTQQFHYNYYMTRFKLTTSAIKLQPSISNSPPKRCEPADFLPDPRFVFDGLGLVREERAVVEVPLEDIVIDGKSLEREKLVSTREAIPVRELVATGAFGIGDAVAPGEEPIPGDPACGIFSCGGGGDLAAGSTSGDLDGEILPGDKPDPDGGLFSDCEPVPGDGSLLGGGFPEGGLTFGKVCADPTPQLSPL